MALAKIFHNRNILLMCFSRIEEPLSRYSSESDPREIRNFNNEVYQAAASIWAYKRNVLGLILRCEIQSNNYPLLVDHISREVAYFTNRIKELNEGQTIPLPEAIVKENVFS